jgi:Winged helix DNA-binding domain
MLNIAHARLLNQRIASTNLQTPKDVVAHMGAMQAQDYPMAKWAVGLRLPDSTDKMIEQALDSGEIVRTHVLRPTWHFVAAEDARWLLKLTAPHIRTSMGTWLKKLELDSITLNKTNALIEKALSGGRHLTRSELMKILEKSGIETNPGRATLLMFNAELEAIVCNGAVREKQQTYALMDEKVPKGLIFTREEAIIELAKRYFTSHAPATLADFQWWSGLPMGDARKGIEGLKNDFISEKINHQTYFFKAQNEGFKAIQSIDFLPAFDEFTVSYKDRSDVIAPHFKEIAMTNNGIFKPIIVENGQVTGIWKRTIKKDLVVIETQFFEGNKPLEKENIAKAKARFGDFSGLKIEVA